MAEKRIPDILAKGGESGVSIEVLAQNAGLDALKLGEFSYLVDDKTSLFVVSEIV